MLSFWFLLSYINFRLSHTRWIRILTNCNVVHITLCNLCHEWCDGYCASAGYVGDEAATVQTLDSEGWLKTGDLCYFDSDGFLYIVDRLKELIKYKAYQVTCYFPS